MRLFWFWWVVYTLMIVMDVVFWVAAMHLTKRRLWRVLVRVFVAGQLAAHLAFVGELVSPAHTPKTVLGAVIIWHFGGLPVFLPLGILFASVQIVRAAARLNGTRWSRPVAAPAGANSRTRRDFIGTCAALAPPLFTICNLNSF